MFSRAVRLVGLSAVERRTQEHGNPDEQNTDTDENRHDGLEDGAERGFVRRVIRQRGVQRAEQRTDDDYEDQEGDDFHRPFLGFVRNGFSPTRSLNLHIIEPR